MVFIRGQRARARAHMNASMPSNMHIDDPKIRDLDCLLQLLVIYQKKMFWVFRKLVIIINTVFCIDLQVNMLLVEVMMADGLSGRNELAD